VRPEGRPSLPPGWFLARLGDIAVPVTRTVTEPPSNVLTISSTKGFVPQAEKWSRFMAGKSLAKYVEVHAGEFAYNRGNSLTYPQGCVYRLTSCDAAAVPFVYFCFRVVSPTADPEFLDHYFRSGALNAQLSRLINAGVRNNGLLNIREAEFYGMRVPIPSLPEQRAIAATFKAMDDAITAGEAVVEQLDRAYRALIDESIRHGSRKSPSGSRPPSACRRVRLGDVCAFSGGNGFTPRDWSAEGLPIIRIQNLNGSRDFNYFAGEPEPKWLVRPGDLLFAWAGSRGSSFGPCLWPGPVGVLNQHIYKLAPSGDVDREFLFYVLQLFTADVERRAHGFKTTLVHLRKSELTKLEFELPPMAEQRAVVEALRVVVNRIEAERALIAQRRRVKAALANELLSGRLRVRDAA
jgi:type I restriction enzyme, S subunit